MLAAWSQAIWVHSGKMSNFGIAKALEVIKIYNLQETKSIRQATKADFTNQYVDMFEMELHLEHNSNDEGAQDTLNEAQAALQ